MSKTSITAKRVTTSEITTALQIVAHGVAKTDFIPAFQNILFEKGRATGYCGSLGVTVNIHLADDCLASGELTTKIFNSFKGATVAIEKKKDGLQLTSAKSSIKLPIQPVEDFAINRPDITAGSKLQVSKKLIAGIKGGLVVASTDATYPKLMGVALIATDGKLGVYASDNYALSVAEGGISYDGPQIVLSTAFCTALIQAVDAYDSELEGTYIYVSEEAVTATVTDKVELFAQPVPTDTLPDYVGVASSLVPNENEFTTPDPVFADAIKRACLFHELGVTLAMSLSVEKNELFCSTETTRGQAHETLPFKSEDVAIAVDPNRLLTVFNDGDGIYLCSNNAVVVRSPSGHVYALAAISI